ncbi:unnamed protein product [Albugo candida]|uniref:Uncharacterized protein n=1 Tax=Albugo candida TaxID=65357 RepID=A0A024GB39_9STRA|nr:unnamed protein product [Albugo candida]|eukprot:CCI44081.1 unnamed protein product [Albugo candida]
MASDLLEADIFQAYCLGGLKPLPTLPGIELTTPGRGSARSNRKPTELGTGTPSGGLADSTHVFRPCVPRFESRWWQKGYDGAPRRRQRFLHVNINLLNEDMDVSRPLVTTPENNCTGVGPGSSERYILVIRIE